MPKVIVIGSGGTLNLEAILSKLQSVGIDVEESDISFCAGTPEVGTPALQLNEIAFKPIQIDDFPDPEIFKKEIQPRFKFQHVKGSFRK